MEGFHKSQYGSMMGAGTAEDRQSAASSPLRIILVGKTGSGKSATGNSILLRKEFKTMLSAQPVTTKCQEATCTWNGRSILVVDTPPIFEAQTPTPETYRDIADCYLLSAPGPHVLLLVTQVGRFTAQDSEAVKRVQEVFGEGTLRHMVILFTHVEDLGGESLDEYVRCTDNTRLRRLVQECGKRYCGFNNRASEEEQRAQLERFMLVLERQERELGVDNPLRNSLYLDAQLLLQSGGSSSGEDRRRFLTQVQRHVEKQRRDLPFAEYSSFRRVASGAKSWMTSHPGWCAALVIGSVLLLVIIISISSRQG